MNPLNREWFFRGFHRSLTYSLGKDEADGIWEDAGKELHRILSSQPELKRHKGAMVLPAVALYRVLTIWGEGAEGLLNAYGEDVGKRFARSIHALTSLPGVDRLVWRHVGAVTEKASSEKLGYRRELVSEPPDMYGVDILSCPFHELAKEVDGSRPTLLIISGVFQYFHEEEVVGFIQNCKAAFPGAEMIFDATSKFGLLYTNWFIKRTGNANALMYFGIDDSRAFAEKCGDVLLEERTFFPDALKMLGKKLTLVTRISMKTAEKKKLVLILHLKLDDKE